MPTQDLTLVPYDRILELSGPGRRHLLLGNGFSIACDPVFRYDSLYDVAVASGLSERAQALFARVGKSNFEGALRLLDDAHWTAITYGVQPGAVEAMKQDVEIIKRTLVTAVTNSHLAHAALLPDEKREAAVRFLQPYHNVFTTNYDLLLYWANLSSGTAPRGDGFRSDPESPVASYVVFSERIGDGKGLFYLHGALHLYVAGGQLRKHCWNRSQRHLTDLVREGLEAGQYPLFIAEGSSEKKLDQIQRNGYLWYALDKLKKTNSPLVVLGHSLGHSDQHIADAIARNQDLTKLFVGLFGDPESEANRDIRASVDRMTQTREQLIGTRFAKRLEVKYFDSTGARPWG